MRYSSTVSRSTSRICAAVRWGTGCCSVRLRWIGGLVRVVHDRAVTHRIKADRPPAD
jgi:hypothetical protein